MVFKKTLTLLITDNLNITNRLLQFLLPYWLQHLEVHSATSARLQAGEITFSILDNT